MNLLFLTPQLPYPPRQGTALRNWGLIRGLAARHNISLVSFVEPGQEIEAPLSAVCQRIWAVPVPRRTWRTRLNTLLFSSQADMARRLASPVFREALHQALAGVGKPGDGQTGDLCHHGVHIEGIELAPYMPDVLSVARTRGGLVVYDAHNAETPLQQRAYETDRRYPARWPGAAYSWIQARRLARFEAWTLRQADCVFCVSPEDAAVLRSLAPECNPVLAPNGIDLGEYQVANTRFPNPTFQAPLASGHTLIADSHNATPASPSLLFTGKMDYRPNVDAVLWFAEEILPRIRAGQPDVQFVIAGQKPHARLSRLAGRPGIVITGAVPDLRPYLDAAAVYVAPLRMGGGTRFKLLEAMALCKPVVSTHFGAEGFPVTNGREMLLADSPAEFAAAVLALLKDESERASLGRAARRFVEQGYDWSVIIPRVEAAYAAAGRSPGRANPTSSQPNE